MVLFKPLDSWDSQEIFNIFLSLGRSIRAEKQIGLTPFDILAQSIFISLKDRLDCLAV